MRGIIIKTTLLLPFPLLAKSLKAMASTAHTELKVFGATLAVVGIAYAGILYVKGGGEGKQKLQDVVTGAVCIFAAGAIVAMIRRITG